MKVGIIGATGRAGKLIAKEAFDRGHEITAIVIDPENLDNKEYAVLNKNIFDLTVDDLKDFDTVINCFGVFEKSKLIQHQTSMMTLINIFEELPDVRLMMVGGAASLYTDETKTQLIFDTIPAEFNGVPKNMKAAFENLKASNVKNWTYFSPAGTFDPNGVRTGSYVIGDNDVAVKNSDGDSYISYADYAIAMVDEMENKKYVGKRITAAAENPNKKKAPEPPKNVDVKGNPVEYEGGLSQYRGPFNYELAGKTFNLFMDNGYDYVLKFVDDQTLEWAKKGDPLKWENYECLKADETTYLVNCEIYGAKPRAGATLVLDLTQNLVTVIVARQGTNKKYPDMVTNEIIFGALKLPGKEIPRKRHGFTDDLVGTRISWQYTPIQHGGIAHVYFDSNYIRVGDPVGIPKEILEKMQETPYDELCYYIKIKDYMYLISFIEEHHTLRGGIGNNMLLLIDAARLRAVGRSFGLHRDRTPENYMFSPIGKWNFNNDGVEGRPSKYRI